MIIILKGRYLEARFEGSFGSMATSPDGVGGAALSAKQLHS